MNEAISKWIAGLLFGIIIAGGGLYIKWINDNITQTALQQAVDKANLDILNAKIDLLLQANRLQYNGPAYTSSKQTK